ncbi:MAG TPA: 50S ribosomal protein L3 [Wenzhouxiangellaceae bacterium]|nr:50S ribosomal protein L3 [Wenzhouxiangellaceae bacterium]
MAIGIVGRKRGMTRIFIEDGTSVPVTVVEADPNRITQIRERDRDGYVALQVTMGSRRASLVNQPAAGHYRTAGVEPGEGLWEFRVDGKEGVEVGDFEVGGEITVERFTNGQKVDVTGTSKGKGFAGVVKRHNFRMQDATHGNSLSHRAPGSIGQCQTPGRVFKGKKMAGHMGAERVTTQNLEIVRVDPERNLLLIRGAVPGAPGGHVLVRPTVKS